LIVVITAFERSPDGGTALAGHHRSSGRVEPARLRPARATGVEGIVRE
jgi:hypothetical protein